MIRKLPLLTLIIVSVCLTSTQAQSWVLHDNISGFITDIEMHNGQRYTTFKTGEVLQGDSIIKNYPCQLFQETGLLGICWWQDSLCVSVSGLDSIQRVICGTDTLLSVSYKSPWSTRHRGGDMVAVDSTLYVAFGDGSAPDSAQSLTNFRGKIVAITSDTSYIFAYGLRNPWKIDTTNGLLYLADVGNQTQEEVDRISLDSIGKNFGWPCIEGNHVHDSTYSCDPTIPPLFTYQRAMAGNGIIGGKFFDGQYWWCDNKFKFGGMLLDTFWTKIPCPEYPDGMYVNGDTIFAYDYTGKIYRWEETPLSLDSIPLDPEKDLRPIVITSEKIIWNEGLNGRIMILTLEGRIVTEIDAQFRGEIDISLLVPRMYVAVLMTPLGVEWRRLFIVW